MSKYWDEINKSLRKMKTSGDIDEIKYRQNFIEEAVVKLKKIFSQFMESMPQIIQSNFHQVVEEDVKLEQKIAKEKAIILEWGKKIRLTEREISFLENSYKKSFLNLFRRKNVPKTIIESDYYYICFHLDNRGVFFPHNSEFTSIPLNEFIDNPKIILPNLEHCLISPQHNNKILKKGIDY